ncbi:hypothetical protein Dda_3750 [Drechslerella dactyloides]|uniref:F-box domain-containing protein n=1 Tax=Drechslerella dactyloides TaxID=74499 RepID=A0AAD6NK72_DREDA|nr:hypothetical protein Dda_3750 [Drechslerella dactyloides]
MSQLSGEPQASLASLPTEIADTIYHSLAPGTLARLARVSKDIYVAVQGPLYRRPVITSFRKLQLFVQTLNTVASWDKTGEARSKWVVLLTLLIDPAVEESTTGRPLTAVLLARLIRVISRYNPAVTITLIVRNSSCQSQPVRSFQSEQFPRVTNLILDLSNDAPTQGSSRGSNSLDSVHARRRHMGADYSYNTTGRQCMPNASFWTRFFNGICFPDLRMLELHHRTGRGARPGAYHGFAGEPILFTELDTVGLAKIERLVVNTVPEFNDIVLLAGLRHAPLLTDLHIEDCHVSYEALEKLLLHALPILRRLVLRISINSEYPNMVRQKMNVRNPEQNNPHLCPHFRRNGRNLKHFEFSAPYICRDIFVDSFETKKLSEAGHPGLLQGDPLGEVASGYLDAVLVTGTLSRLRQNRDTDGNMTKAAGDSKSFEEDKAIVEKERSLRTRRATIEKEGWSRKVHMLEGVCVDGDTFDELVVLAEVEEGGVEWTLGHLPSSKAMKVVNGMVSNVRHADEFVRGRPPRERAHRRNLEHDFNDGPVAHFNGGPPVQDMGDMNDI